MNRRIRVSFLLSSIIISIISYLRYYLTGNLALDVSYPNEQWSFILFMLYLIAIVLSLFGYYNAVFKSDYSFGRIRVLSYFVFFISFLSLPFLSNDIFSYLAIGDVAENVGLNPYTDYRFFYISSFDVYVSPTWQGTPYFRHGPLHTIMMYLVSLFSGGGGIWFNLFVYKLLVLFTGFVIIEFAYFVLARSFFMSIRLGSVQRRRIFAFIVLSPVLWIQGIGQGHNDIFVALFLFCGLYFMLQHRYFLAVLFFVFAFSIKLYALLAIFILVYYIMLRYRFSYLTFLWSIFILVFAVGLSMLLYLPFWEGYDTFLPYMALFSELKSPMNSLSFLLGYFTLHITDAFSPLFVYGVFRYLVLVPAFIVGLYLVYRMKYDFSSFVYLCGKAFVLFFSFGVARFHPWYFIAVLVFFAFRDLSVSWFLWGVIFFSLVNLVDIYNFMGHESISIMIALPLSLILVNLLLLFRLKRRFIKL